MMLSGQGTRSTGTGWQARHGVHGGMRLYLRRSILDEERDFLGGPPGGIIHRRRHSSAFHQQLAESPRVNLLACFIPAVSRKTPALSEIHGKLCEPSVVSGAGPVKLPSSGLGGAFNDRRRRLTAKKLVAPRSTYGAEAGPWIRSQLDPITATRGRQTPSTGDEESGPSEDSRAIAAVNGADSCASEF